MIEDFESFGDPSSTSEQAFTGHFWLTEHLTDPNSHDAAGLQCLCPIKCLLVQLKDELLCPERHVSYRLDV